MDSDELKKTASSRFSVYGTVVTIARWANGDYSIAVDGGENCFMCENAFRGIAHSMIALCDQEKE